MVKNSLTKQTLRLSDDGLARIEKARDKKGWTKYDERWLKEATEIAETNPPPDWNVFWQSTPYNFSPSLSTLKNKFLKRQNIRAEYFVALCQAVGVVEWEQAVNRENTAEGEPPQSAPFYGRKTILDRLQTSVLDRTNCRSILLHGRAGIGKTAIASRLIQSPEIDRDFSKIVWLSLESKRSLSEFIDLAIGHLSKGKVDRGNLADLLLYLQQDRYLIVVDQWETILARDSIDDYQVGYENYQELLQYIAKKHKSCIVIVSRELRQCSSHLSKTLEVEGLNYQEDRDFLIEEKLHGTDLDLEKFIKIYDNPSILKLIADRVRTIHGGKIATLVTKDATIHTNNDTIKIIDAEFRSLRELEQSIVYWLAIWRNSISYQQLQQSFPQDLSQSTLDESLYSLIKIKSFVKTNPQSEYYLEPVTLKEITNRFVRKVVEELSVAIERQDNTNLKLVIGHALTIGDDEDILKEQMRRIVRSISEQLLKKFSPQILQRQLEQMRSTIDRGYAADNLNVLLEAIDI
jgi:hypothetical protein